MLEQHPITPPSELYKQWEGMPRSLAFEAAYRAGADQELEACCEWLDFYAAAAEARDLRAARRPKPPSLADQAMQAMHRVDVIWATDEFGKETMDDINVIRRALERLQELENND